MTTEEEEELMRMRLHCANQQLNLICHGEGEEVPDMFYTEPIEQTV